MELGIVDVGVEFVCEDVEVGVVLGFVYVGMGMDLESV